MYCVNNAFFLVLFRGYKHKNVEKGDEVAQKNSRKSEKSEKS